MKVKNVAEATEQDLSYARDELFSMLEDITDSIEQAESNMQKNIEIHKTSINADFDGLRRYENAKHDKKWRPAKIAIGIAGVAGFVGLIAAGAITKNPTFFSQGNLITGGLVALASLGFGNYLATFPAFSPKHQQKLENIEQERQSRLENVEFSEQALHDQKEIEVNKAWMDAVANELGIDKSPKVLRAVAQMLEEKNAKTL